MLKSRGFTAVELLVAIAILATVLTLASQGIVTSLRAKNSQDSLVAAQDKARRIGQAISYDVRSSIFGSLIDSPYPTTTQNVSFLLLDGAAGFNVTGKTASGYTISTQSTSMSSLTVGSRVLVVNQNGEGFLYPISSISSSGTNHTINFSGCTKTPIDAIGDSLMFQVSTVGYRYNGSNKTLYRKVNNNPEEIVAFDIQSTDSGFAYDVDFLYEAADGSIREEINPPRHSTGAIRNSFTNSGKVFTLARLQFGIRVQGKNFSGNVVGKDVTTTIEVKDAVTHNNFRGVTQGVLSCN